MANWNNPNTAQTYTASYQSIRDKDNALAKMFDGTADTNLPTGTIRINSGQGYRLEKWNGSSWSAITTSLGSLDSGLTGLTSAEITQLKNINSVTISNTQWGYLGALDQALGTTTSPTFGGATLNGAFNTRLNSAHWNATITDDSDTNIINVLDSGSNSVGVLASKGMDGVGAGTLHIDNWDDVLVDGASVPGHIASTSNPHGVTATQVSLGNVINKALAFRKNSGSNLNATWNFNTTTQELTITTS